MNRTVPPQPTNKMAKGSRVKSQYGFCTTDSSRAIVKAEERCPMVLRPGGCFVANWPRLSLWCTRQLKGPAGTTARKRCFSPERPIVPSKGLLCVTSVLWATSAFNIDVGYVGVYHCCMQVTNGYKRFHERSTRVLPTGVKRTVTM